MALPNSNISTTLVGNTLGSSSRDVGTLCTHENINKWSKWKPVRVNKVTGIVLQDIIDAKAGLGRDIQTQTFSYLRPRGGANNEPYRLGDFRNYNHQAIPPVVPSITKIEVLPSGAIIPGPNWELVEGMTYAINFKLIPGDIDPTWLDPTTNRIKNTDPSGGYGGITWVFDQSGPGYEYTRNSGEVFSAELLPPGADDYVQVVVAKIVTGGLRLEYVRYEGSSTNKYKTFNRFIEDDGYSESYRSLFSVRALSAGINYTAPFTLMKLMENLELRLRIFNNEDFPINVKMRMSYKKVETGNEYTYNGDTFSLPASTSQLRFLPIQGWSLGLNTYELKVRMYLVKPDASEIEIDYRMETESITISSGV